MNYDIEYIAVGVEEIKRLLQEESETLPEVYLNASEVCRQLSIAPATLGSWVKDGLVGTYDNPRAPQNRYLLSDVLWVKKHRYKRLGPTEFQRLLDEKRQYLSQGG